MTIEWKQEELKPQIEGLREEDRERVGPAVFGFGAADFDFPGSKSSQNDQNNQPTEHKLTPFGFP